MGDLFWFSKAQLAKKGPNFPAGCSKILYKQRQKVENMFRLAASGNQIRPLCTHFLLGNLHRGHCHMVDIIGPEPSLNSRQL
ncbi:hypothetical protein MNBD_ALPHA11-2010 [hydrothermal vent metagenome]|uniref:Uncharacterized protein n=1 Tax=hydrothermal vent metagenome TaxID=652676 RepID=A0A3B0TN47_9ZZZZ